MFRWRLIPENTKIPFMGMHKVLMAISIVISIIFIVLLIFRGLNFGVDFTGGILMEVRTEQAADLEAMRGTLGQAGVGSVALQEFGAPTDVLIRLQQQEGGETAQNAAIEKVRTALKGLYGEGVEYRRVEVVGPKVGDELIQDGIIAVLVSMVLMLIYVWFRFELPFGIGSMIALVHDVIFTLGIYALSGFEFSLSTVAAVLLIIGYSMNDTVVVYDRVRENLRKYKAMPLLQLIDLSVNETLARTTMTSFTTLLALIALLIFGGEVIRPFAFAMVIGVLIGTYSSIFVASASLLYIRPVRKADHGKGTAGYAYEQIELRHREEQDTQAARRTGRQPAEILPPEEAAETFAELPPDEPPPGSPASVPSGRKRSSSLKDRRRRRGR